MHLIYIPTDPYQSIGMVDMTALMSLRSHVVLWMQKQNSVTSMTVQLKQIPSDSLIQNNSCASYLHLN